MFDTVTISMSVFLAALLVVVFLCSCGSDATFDGNKTGDENHFDIEFNMLNTSYTHELRPMLGKLIYSTFSFMLKNPILKHFSYMKDWAIKYTEMTATNT